MYLFTLHINGKDRDLLAVDKIHVDLNWRYLNEYLDQITTNDEILFLKQGNEIIAKNQLARENWLFITAKVIIILLILPILSISKNINSAKRRIIRELFLLSRRQFIERFR